MGLHHVGEYMEKTSLDDFVTGDRAAESDDPTENEDEETAMDAESSGESGTREGDVTDESVAARADTDGDPEAGRPEVPTVTAMWSADAEACDECGEPSAWRWAQEAAMVCPTCKEW
jgi:hypothetical protein